MKKYILHFLIWVSLGTSGCQRFVQLEIPKSQLLGQTVFEEKSTAEAALAALYAQLRDASTSFLNVESMGLHRYLGYYADEQVFLPDQDSEGRDFYRHTLFPGQGTISSFWTTAYNQLYTTNALIEGIDNSTGLKEADRAQIKGEALFIRALLHFYLVNLFGDIPYVNGTDYTINRSLPREPVDEVYKKIMDDLMLAEQSVSAEYPSVGRVRVNQSVVRALMARVYLYHGDWKAAEEYADKVIGFTQYYDWVDDLDQVFLKESTGTIWSFKPQREGYNGEDAFTHIILARPYENSFSEDVVDAFEPGDQRRNHWIGSYTEGAETWYFSYKYKERNNDNSDKEYSVILRLAEQYLIRAEARAQLDDIGGAQRDLNKARHRAGLGDTGAADKEALLNAILQERRFELFAEFGHRWFDLKRMGKAAEVLGPIKANWRDTDVLLPVPEKEILINPNLLPQNDGY